MTTALRPMTTGELLDRTFNLYRNNFALFAGISALAAGVLVAATVLLFSLGIALPTPGARVDPGAAMSAFAIYFAVLALFYLIGASLAAGATIYAVSKVHLGQPVTIGESYSRVFPRLGRIINIILSIIIRMIGVFILMYLAVVLLVLVLGLALAGAVGRDGGYVIGVIVGITVAVVGYGFVFAVYFIYSLSVQACLLENLKAGPALRRSSFLSKGSRWRIVLIYLLMGIIGFALSYALHLPALWLVQRSVRVAIIWQFAATFVAYTLSFPISTIAISLVYYDQRVRKEAFDLQLMMESLGQAPQQAATAAPIG